MTVRRICSLLVAAALITSSNASALNLNTAAVKGLSQAYGFVAGQDDTLERISKQHPDFAPSVDLARARFALTFPEIKTRLEAELIAALGRDSFEQLVKKIEESRTTLHRQPLTREAAAEFIDQVQSRARGEIESPVLEYLLTVKYAANPPREYSDGFRQRFDTDGTGKARGIKLSLRLPRSWVARDGERPHIVKKWTTEGGFGLESVMLDIRDAKGYDPDRREIDRFLRSGEVKEAVPPGGIRIASGAFTVEGRPGYWIDMKLSQERAGVDVYQRMLLYQIFFRGRAIGIMCQTGARPQDSGKVDESIARFRPPPIALVGPDAPVRADDLLRGATEFYRRWTDRNANLHDVAANASRATAAATFEVEPFAVLFHEALVEWLIVALRPAERLRRIQHMRQRLVAETSLSASEVDDRLASVPFTLSLETLQRVWDEMFMIDLDPSNRERFGVDMRATVAAIVESHDR